MDLLNYGLLGPVFALIGWTFVMWAWMYATRIPAMQRLKIDPQEAARTGTLNLPPEVSRVADNYNHLHEQPTIFYALAIGAQLAGAMDATNVWLAWGYVALRVVHSLVQATVNIVMIRFLIFTIGTLVMFALFVRTAMHHFGQVAM
jgi:hypothetical protein